MSSVNQDHGPLHHQQMQLIVHRDGWEFMIPLNNQVCQLIEEVHRNNRVYRR